MTAQTIVDQKAARDDPERLLRLDLRFHPAMARATRSGTVVQLLGFLLGGWRVSVSGPSSRGR